MRFQNKLSVVVPLFVFLFAVPFLSVQFAQADTITVTTTADQYDTDPNNCSLREAVELANTNSMMPFGGCTRVDDGNGDADTILLTAVNDNPTTYFLTITCGEDDINGNNNSCGDFDILDTSGSTTIRGVDTMGNIAAPGQVTVQGLCNIQDVGTDNCFCLNAGDAPRIFHVGPRGLQSNAPSLAAVANFQGFTIARGIAQEKGGGIRVNERATANLDLMILNENVGNNRGGAIATVGDNSAPNVFQAFANISRTRLSNNCSNDRGGALSNEGSVVNIYKSEFFNNANNDSGSAIATNDVDDIGASTLVETSTFTQNSTQNQGTIHNEDSDATTTVRSSTIVNNSVNPGSAGGVNNDDGAGAFTLVNTLVAFNDSSECGGVITTGGNNATSDASCFGGGAACDFNADDDKPNCSLMDIFDGTIPALSTSPANPARFIRPPAGSDLIAMGNITECNSNGVTVFDGTQLIGEDQQCCPYPPLGANFTCDIGAVQADLSYPQCVTPPVTGCCRTAPDMCFNNIEQGQCAGDFEANASCDEGCPAPITGCCRTGPGIDMCMDGVIEVECAGDFEANALCSQGGCPPPVTGCCRTAPDMCSDNIIQSDCAGDFEANALCSQGGCPPPITGCCRTAPDMCSDNVEQGQCQGQFEANADCVNGCLPPVTGCCRTSPTMCQENIDQGQCQGDFEANANCSTGCLTEPVGCCRESANMCENGVLQSDCPDGEFEANATCENEGCDNTPTGCCRTSIDMCQDGVLETNCENGEFEANAGCDTGGCVVEPIGCCRTSADMCQDGVMESNCTNGEFEANSTCSEGCNTVPTGCCRTGQGSDMCEDGVLESNCANGEFEANAGCDTGGCESEPVGCCRTLDMCQEGVLESNCEDGDFEANATCAEGCNADPIGCCVDSENDTCESPVFDSDCDGTFSAALSCNIFGGCGDPLVVNGCCEIGDTCEDVTNVVCAGRNGDFTPNEMCNIENTCGPLPTGCCLEDDICRDNVLESNCDGLYNENTSCGSGDCIVPDGGCCFLNGAEESAFIASRQVDPEKCVETTMVMCENLGGSFQGEGTMCTEFPDECGETPPPTRNVPTISQWGLIVMAGLLGIFSLYVIARRQKYNVV